MIDDETLRAVWAATYAAAWIGGASLYVSGAPSDIERAKWAAAHADRSVAALRLSGRI